MSTQTEPGTGTDDPGPTPTDQVDPERRSNLIAGGVAAAALAFVGATRPEVITGSFGTVGSTIRVLGLLVAFATFAWLVRRFVANRIAARAIVWGLGGALLLVAVVPAYFDEEVDQDLATSAADLGLEEPAAADEGVGADNDTTDAAADADESSAAPGDDAESEAGAEAEAGAEVEAAPAQPVKLTTGQLSGLAGHRGSGEAAVYELDDGTRFVRLEDFEVSNGPGIELWLVPRADAESPDGGTKLADLPGNTGNFNAAVPGDVATTGDVTVLLWCAPIGTPMAHATQSPA